MKITLLEHTSNAEETIGRMAAECYDAKTDTESCVRRAKHCKDAGHLATLRFAHATFNVAGISRVCSHQLVRVAHAGILQRSQRYTKAKLEFVEPEVLKGLDDHFILEWRRIQKDAAALYTKLSGGLMRKEDARYILPQSCTTSLNVCMNFQGWRDFLRNRNCNAAQWEIREVAQEIQRKLHEIAPNIFDEVKKKK